MYTIKRFFLFFCIIAFLYGCTQSPSEATADVTQQATASTPSAAATSQPQPDPHISYEEAVAALDNISNIQLHISISQETTAGKEVFTNASQQAVTLLNRGTDQLRAKITEAAVYGDYATDISEIYVGGTAYATVYGSNFSSEMTPEEFTARYLPVILLDASNYETVAWKGHTTLSFSDATALEAWLPVEAADYLSAEGTATLDSNGNLTSATYSVTYRCSGVTVSTQITQELTTPQDIDIEIPADASSYVPIGCIDAPKMMEQAYGYLLQADTVTVSTLKSTVSQAAGILLNQQVSINSYDTDMIQVEQSVYQTDYTGQSLTDELLEVFRDGVYTAASNGESPIPNTSVTKASMLQYIQTYLLSQIPDLGYLADAACTDLGSCYLIEYTGTEDLAQNYCKEANSLLFNDETFLNDIASNYETLAMDAYLAIDKHTGLPTAAGISYSGSHTISDISYLLTVQADQSLNLASFNSYEAITELSSPDTPSETPATPLFYRVTGGNGQLMWLLGTIHVGDDRTAYLPQEIYDAFTSADALAVEFDTEAFDVAAEEDEALQALLSDYYYYSDGSTAADHIRDTELYDYALKLMKASGSYNFNTPYLKPSMWGSAIDSFNLQLGRRLASDKGVDTRLLKLAKAQGKKILDIESGEFQIRMLTGWSDALQEALLSDSVSVTAVEYNQSLEELYTLWCAGDEAALTEALTDDISELTDEEKALHYEYNTAMSTDRNATMLEAAKEYLESGETVFYAVGLAHLLVEDGLVNTLRAAGYTVEPVPYT